MDYNINKFSISGRWDIFKVKTFIHDEWGEWEIDYFRKQRIYQQYTDIRIKPTEDYYKEKQE
jgi:hypothetical protein